MQEQENTQTRKHSMLSPSSSSIWLNCTPSAAMSAFMPQKDTVYTTTGTDAHALAERKVRARVFGEQFDDITAGIETYNALMDECTNEYADYVDYLMASAMEEGLFPHVYTETTLDLSMFVPEGKGTADLILVAGDTLHVVDFKYGSFKSVEAKGNTQMRIYAAGAQEMLRQEYGEFSNISMTIFQPRMGNVETDKISGEELKAWVEEILIPKAEEAFHGRGETKEGDWCEFCPAKVVCRKKREQQVRDLEKLDVLRQDFIVKRDIIKKDFKGKKMDKETKRNAFNNILTPEEMAIVLKLGVGMDGWISDIRDYAMSRALQGEEFPGFKLVSTVTPSKLTEDAADKIEELGFDPWKPREVKSKTALRDEIANPKFFAEKIEPLLTPGEERAKLVDINDKAEAKPYTYFTETGTKADPPRKKIEETEKAEEKETEEAQ